MLCKVKDYFLLFLVILFGSTVASSNSNEFETELNPGCGEQCDNGTLLAYSRLQRHADSVHVLLTVGDMLGDLSVSFIQSSEPKQKLSFDWEALLSDDSEKRRNAIKFAFPANGSTIGTFGLTFTRLIEYDDTSDTVDPSKTINQNSSYIIARRLSDFNWHANLHQASGSAYELTLTANSTNDNANVSEAFLPNGQLSFKLSLSAEASRATELPRLQFTSNNSQLEIKLQNLRSNFASSRFALEAALLADTATSQKLQSISNIDDEYTPGIFHIYNWLALSNAKKDYSSLCYVQWRPVCYKTNQPSIINSTVVHSWQLQALTASQELMINNSFAYSIFGNAGSLPASMSLNSSFGQRKDKFYMKTNYIAWTLSVGIGSPPSDSVSSLVMIVIGCGLGLPVLLMLATGLFICVRKLRGSDARGGDSTVSDYQPINA